MLDVIPRIFCITAAKLMATLALPVAPLPSPLLGPDQGWALSGVHLQGGGNLSQKSLRTAGRLS